jgi:hypothetical protein
MNYGKFSLNYQSAGAVAEVSLQGVESDVFLVDTTNLSRFEHGQQFSYHGGHYKSSPVRLRIPTNGAWTIVVVPGQGGSVNATVRAIAAA